MYTHMKVPIYVCMCVHIHGKKVSLILNNFSESCLRNFLKKIKKPSLNETKKLLLHENKKGCRFMVYYGET